MMPPRSRRRRLRFTRFYRKQTAETPPAFESATAEKADAPVNLLIAAHRTTAQRYSDSWLTSGKPRRRAVAVSMRLRRQDDANFSNRTRWLARRIEDTRSAAPPELAAVSTGEEFLRVLIEASRRGPIANLVVYGHAAANALFMREDRGFYAAVDDVARETNIVEGTERGARLAAARDGRARSHRPDGAGRGRRHPFRPQRRDRVRGLRDGRQARHRCRRDRGARRRDRGRDRHRLDRRDRPVDGARARVPRSRIFAPQLGAVFPAAGAGAAQHASVIDALKYLNLIAPQPDGPAVASAALSASN